jgi:hypothetical protein
VLLAATHNTACTMFGASNAVTWLSIRRNISNDKAITFIFVKIDELWRFASCRACVQAYYSVHNDLRLNCSSFGVYTSQYLNPQGNYGYFSTKTTNVRILQVVGLVARLNKSCTMFCASNAVTWVSIRRNISIGKAMTVIFRQNQRIVAFCE